MAKNGRKNIAKDYDYAYVGIDVAKLNHEICIKASPDLYIKKKFSITNTVSGYEKLVSVLQGLKVDQDHILITMEVTGNYGLNLYQRLRNDGYRSLMISSSSVSDYRRYKSLVKTDAIDADVIATIASREEARETWVPKKEYADLRLYIRLKDKYSTDLKKYRIRLLNLLDTIFPNIQKVFKTGRNTMYAVLRAYPTPQSIIDADAEELFYVINTASKSRYGLDKARELISAAKDDISVPTYSDDAIRIALDDCLDFIEEYSGKVREYKKRIKDIVEDMPMYRLLMSFPGCGEDTAAVCISEIGDISRFEDARKLVAYAGMSIAIKLSGTSVKSNGRITKKGSKYLRHSLYLITEYARRLNPVIGAFFEKKKQGKQKRHVLAVNSCTNKVIHMIYSVLKHKSEFILYHKDLQKLSEEAREEFFSRIQFDVENHPRRKVFLLEDEHGEIRKFVYKR